MPIAKAPRETFLSELRDEVVYLGDVIPAEAFTEFTAEFERNGLAAASSLLEQYYNSLQSLSYDEAPSLLFGTMLVKSYEEWKDKQKAVLEDLEPIMFQWLRLVSDQLSPYKAGRLRLSDLGITQPLAS